MKNITVIFGDSGVGKTFLLKKFRSTSSTPVLVSGDLDIDDRYKFDMFNHDTKEILIDDVNIITPVIDQLIINDEILIERKMQPLFKIKAPDLIIATSNLGARSFDIFRFDEARLKFRFIHLSSVNNIHP